MEARILARVVRHLEAGRLLPYDTFLLVSPDGALPLSYALSCGHFLPGDLVEVSLVSRDGKAGEKANCLDATGRSLAEPVPYQYSHSISARSLVVEEEEVDPFLTPEPAPVP